MDEASVWAMLSAIPIGTVVAWIAVIGAILVALGVGIVKLYRLFTKYRELKDKDKEQKQKIDEYGEALLEIRANMADMKDKLDEQSHVNLKQVRYSIIQICDNALADGQISAWKLRLLTELYDEYIGVFHANGYIKEIVERTLELPIVGKLDD